MTRGIHGACGDPASTGTNYYRGRSVRQAVAVLLALTVTGCAARGAFVPTTPTRALNEAAQSVVFGQIGEQCVVIVTIKGDTGRYVADVEGSACEKGRVVVEAVRTAKEAK